MDVKNVFLNCELDEMVYMAQPEGFIDAEFPDRACLLKKALYGLKQAPRTWFNTIAPVIASFGLQKSPSDNGIFVRSIKRNEVMLSLYMDDLIISCSSMIVMKDIKKKLAANFEMKDLGPIRHCLGIDIEYDQERRTVKLSQPAGINKILEKFKMLDCKGNRTPDAKGITHPHRRHAPRAERKSTVS